MAFEAGITRAGLRWASAALMLAGPLILSGCEPARPRADATLGPHGAAGRVGVDQGPVSVDVGTGGPRASVDVINTPNVGVNVGTTGPSASVRMGNAPLRVGVGRGGIRLSL